MWLACSNCADLRGASVMGRCSLPVLLSVAVEFRIVAVLSLYLVSKLVK